MSRTTDIQPSHSSPSTCMPARARANMNMIQMGFQFNQKFMANFLKHTNPIKCVVRLLFLRVAIYCISYYSRLLPFYSGWPQ